MNTPEKIRQLIRQGEGISVEFKTSRDRISRGVYRTVCAFLNRNGGTLLLGVDDSGEVLGVDPEAVARMKSMARRTVAPIRR